MMIEISAVTDKGITIANGASFIPLYTTPSGGLPKKGLNCNRREIPNI